MIPWGTIIGNAIGLGSSIYGGVQAARAAKKAKANVEQQKADNESWYNRRYNEDATQRADAQRVLTQTQNMLRRQNRAAAGAAAVAGGNSEAVAQQKALANEALADATSRIAAAGEARKDAIEEQYKATERGLNNQLNNLELQRAQAIAGAAQGAGTAAMKAGVGVDDLLNERREYVPPQRRITAPENYPVGN